MTPILDRIRANGGDVIRCGWSITLRPGRLTPAALAWVRERKDALMAEVWPEHAAFEERAAIMEFDGGLSRRRMDAGARLAGPCQGRRRHVQARGHRRRDMPGRIRYGQGAALRGGWHQGPQDRVQIRLTVGLLWNKSVLSQSDMCARPPGLVRWRGPGCKPRKLLHPVLSGFSIRFPADHLPGRCWNAPPVERPERQMVPQSARPYDRRHWRGPVASLRAGHHSAPPGHTIRRGFQFGHQHRRRKMLTVKHVRVDGEFVFEAAGVEMLDRKDGSREGIVWFRDGEGNPSRLFGSGICYVMNASGSTVATYYTFADPEGAVQDEFGNFAAEATAEHGADLVLPA